MRNSDEIKENSLVRLFKTSENESAMHDEIAIWIYGIMSDIPRLKELGIKELSVFLDKYNSEEYAIKVIREFEAPVYSISYNSKKLAGNIDLLVRFVATSKEEMTFEGWKDYQRTKKVTWKGFDVRTMALIIEIKTSVNFGETVRQMKYYASLFDSSGSDKVLSVVCAPGNRFKEIFEEQNINYVEFKA